jgi:hypothetical protein
MLHVGQLMMIGSALNKGAFQSAAEDNFSTEDSFSTEER